MNKFGLQEKDLLCIIQSFKEYSTIDKVSIYGSRARGDFKDGSDIDLVLYGQNIDFKTISAIHSKLENNNFIPLMFDITHYENINNPNLQNRIDNESQLIYQRD